MSAETSPQPVHPANRSTGRPGSPVQSHRLSKPQKGRKSGDLRRMLGSQPLLREHSHQHLGWAAQGRGRPHSRRGVGPLTELTHLLQPSSGPQCTAVSSPRLCETPSFIGEISLFSPPPPNCEQLTAFFQSLCGSVAFQLPGHVLFIPNSTVPGGPDDAADRRAYPPDWSQRPAPRA